MINFIEVPEVKHLTKYWGSSTQDDPCRSNIGGRDPSTPVALTPTLGADHIIIRKESNDVIVIWSWRSWRANCQACGNL